LEHTEIKSIVLATDATVSDKAATELAQRGVIVESRVLDKS
jgi:CRISPR/Cas system-associated endonuclease Cas1